MYLKLYVPSHEPEAVPSHVPEALPSHVPEALPSGVPETLPEAVAGLFGREVFRCYFCCGLMVGETLVLSRGPELSHRTEPETVASNEA